MIIRRTLQVAALVLAFVPMLAMAARISATLDRSAAQLGETVTLNLRVVGGNDNPAPPDLSALGKDFDILGTSQNSSLSVVNGTASSAVTFGIALRPRHLGTIQIPPIALAGGQTDPLQLQVTAPDSGASAQARQDLFLETQVQPGQGYVGEQLSYVVRLFFANQISIRALDLPQVDGAQLSPLGDAINYTAERGGRQYHVIEQRYTLVAQHPGRLDLPGASFHGDAVDPNDPDSFFGASTPVSASAPAQSIEIKAAPASWGNTAWLPARQVTLSLDGWPGAGQTVRVGQPLNLVMDLQVIGLPADVLPALSLPSIDGVTVYPDKPATDTRGDGQWLVGHRRQAFAVIPQHAGSLTLPAITLKWFNVLTDQQQIAQIPARTLTVLPADAAGSSQPSPASGNTAPADGVAAPPVSGGLPHANETWRWIAIGSVGLWLASMGGWLLWRRRARPAAVPPPARSASVGQQRQQFLAAARGTDLAAQERSLLAWARVERPEIQQLGSLRQALADQQQCAAIDMLQQRRYAGVARGDDDALLEQAFRDGFVWRAADSADPDDDLPPLYPFKLH